MSIIKVQTNPNKVAFNLDAAARNSYIIPNVITTTPSLKDKLVSLPGISPIESEYLNTAMVDPDSGKIVYPEDYSITTKELQLQIDSIVEKGISYSIVDLLPTNPKEGVFYYLRITNTSNPQQQYVEYTWVVDPVSGPHWEKWGLDYQDLISEFVLKDASNLTESDKKSWAESLGYLTSDSVLDSGIINITSTSAKTSANVFGTSIDKNIIYSDTFTIDVSDKNFPLRLYVRDDLGTNVIYDIIDNTLIIKEIISNDVAKLNVTYSNGIITFTTDNTNISKFRYALIQI